MEPLRLISAAAGCRGWGSILLGAALAACVSTPSPVPLAKAPAVGLSARVFAGTAVSGQLARESELSSDPSEALELSCRVYFLDHLPDSVLESATREARFLSNQGAPIVPVADLTARARVGTGPAAVGLLTQELAAHRAVQVSELWCALPSGTTGGFRAEIEDRLATVQVSRAPEREPLQLELELHVDQDFEALLLQPELLPNGEEVVCLIPFEVSPYTDSSLAFVLQAQIPSADDAEHAKRFEQALEDVRLARAEVVSSTASIPAEERLRRELARATDALEVVKLHRSALIFISSRADAVLARDISLVASDEILAACVKRALDDFRFDDVELDRDQRGWRLECACILVLTDLFARGELTPELSAVLLRRAGEVGRYPGLLEDVLTECGKFADLEARLVKANTIFLEDRHPAARVRAFDWLATHGEAPAGYDPMASREERRAALEASRAAKDEESDE